MILFYNKDLKIEKGTLLRARLVHFCFGYALSLYRILIQLKKKKKLQFNKVFASTLPQRLLLSTNVYRILIVIRHPGVKNWYKIFWFVS